MAYRGPDEKPESVTAIESLNGGNVQVAAENTSNTASSDATLKAKVSGTSAGDAKVHLEVGTTSDWTIGVDNSDSDSLKIGPSDTVGTSTAVTITTGGATTISDLTATTLTAATANVTDSTFSIKDNADATKVIQFQASGITTGTTRTLTAPDANTTIVGTDATQTLTNKTLTAPVISTISNTGTLTLPTSTDTLVGRDTTDTLTNKTLTSPSMTAPTVSSGVLTVPAGSVSAPSITTAGDTNTGLYFSAANEFAFVSDGTAMVQVTASGTAFRAAGAQQVAIISGEMGLGGTTSLANASFVSAAAGSASLPSHTFTGDLNTGIYSSAADVVDISAGGTQVLSATAANGVKLRGTTAADNAATGFIGEFSSSSPGTVAFAATGVFKDATSLSLTAGDWEITWKAYIQANGATITYYHMAVTTTSGNSTSGITNGVNNFLATPAAGYDTSGVVANYRVSISSTTTYYAKMMAVYTVATPNCIGYFQARRIR